MNYKLSKESEYESSDEYTTRNLFKENYEKIVQSQKRLEEQVYQEDRKR